MASGVTEIICSRKIQKTAENTTRAAALIVFTMSPTAIALIYSPWRQRSDANMNTAVTLTFLHLGKIKPWDAAFYVTAQFIG